MFRVLLWVSRLHRFILFSVMDTLMCSCDIHLLWLLGCIEGLWVSVEFLVILYILPVPKLECGSLQSWLMFDVKLKFLCFQIALNKPSGLQVLPGGLFQQRTVLTQLSWRMRKQTSSLASQESHPVPVHRLGRGTSGSHIHHFLIDADNMTKALSFSVFMILLSQE